MKRGLILPCRLAGALMSMTLEFLGLQPRLSTIPGWLLPSQVPCTLHGARHSEDAPWTLTESVNECGTLSTHLAYGLGPVVDINLGFCTVMLCDFEQVAFLLWASTSSPIKWACSSGSCALFYKSQGDGYDVETKGIVLPEKRWVERRNTRDIIIDSNR